VHYSGTDNKIVWEGESKLQYRDISPPHMAVLQTNYLMFDAGTLIPENWLGKRIKVTVELVGSSHHD